jgi:YVTN family beta-propeller protein
MDTRSSTASARAATVGLGMAALLGSLVLSAAGQGAKTTPAVEKSAKIGPGVYEIVSSADAVYVASAGGRGAAGAKPTIFALDPKTLNITKSIDVSSAAAFGLGINEKTHTLYTSNTRSGSVSAIDLKTGSIVATIKAEDDPSAHLFRVLVDEDTNTVYVSVASKNGNIWVIDGKTNTLTGKIADVGVTPIGLALDKAANKLYVATQGGNDVAAVDLKTKTVVSRIPTGGERSTMLAFDAKGNRLFVTNQGSGDVSILDAKAGSLIKTVKTGAGALGLGYNPKTNLIYVANRGAGTVTVVDGASYEVVADVPAGTLPNTVTIDLRTNATYVTNKAKSGGRGAPPVDDPNGDTVTMIKH